jgi:hypothetical protein
MAKTNVYNKRTRRGRVLSTVGGVTSFVVVVVVVKLRCRQCSKEKGERLKLEGGEKGERDFRLSSSLSRVGDDIGERGGRGGRRIDASSCGCLILTNHYLVSTLVKLVL